MNFDYLKAFPEMNKLYDYCSEAEEFALYKPNISATSARKAMEFVVKFIYASLAGQSSDLTVFEMVTDYRFIDYIGDDTLINTIHYIRKMGNVAVHEGELSKDESLKILEELHFLVGEFCILLGLINDYPQYEKPGTSAPAPAPTKADEKKAAEAPKKVTVEPELVAKFAPRMRQVKFDVKFKRNEEENKKLYMAACLREAGWPIVSQPDQAMPGCAGINMLLDDGDTVDYILYGRDNRPLAIIEYTTTKDNLIEGRAKGIEKANKLSVKLGYKPIVYYTNGYHIFIIDQLGYRPRRVFQFHSIEELELLKLRATMRQDITKPVIDDAITNRDYQKKAIAATCNAFAQYRRHSLLVMATGTGKTRVSISLVDVLMKANWVKNVLFLADRTSLVRQAHKNFNKLLPSVTTSIYAGGSMQKDPNARIIFSTYQTMINLINDDTREFSIGRFDLIIIDEAHRSIFKKYSALFHYFDALMIGLTATPRAEDNKSTYQMFEMKNGHPDYAYELEEAIADKYLVGFSVLDKTTDTLRRGIHYDELSDEEKEKFEDAFAEGDAGEEDVDYSGTVIDAKTMKSTKYINLGTIDAMLNDLMKNGLKIGGGDKLGKTIIFAGNHLEAEKIVERFQKLYPYLGHDFCKLIDSQVVNNLALIDNFGERDQLPQIAVSVDMMDTGIDVPDVLNLVFFKTVASKIKFLQMVGRGTRLSPDVFGPGMDKKGFLIFDYYDNFNYFRARNTWSTVDEKANGKSFSMTPQSILLNERKLNILRNLIESDVLTPFDVKYRDELKAYFISMTRALCNDDIEVQYNMSYVSKYRTAEHWDGFTDAKINEIKEHILPLFPSDPSPVKVKSFDLMIYVIEDEVPKRMGEEKDIRRIRHGFGNVGKKIDDMLEELTKLKTIPAIVKKEQLIKQMRNADLLFDNFSLEECERVRKELRDLMAYIPDNSKYYIIDAKDFVIDVDSGEVAKEKTYAEKAREYIAKGSPALAKIRNLDELTQEEKNDLEATFTSRLGTPADYAAWSGNKPLLPFLRIQVGIADSAIQTKFGSFLNSDTLNAQQLAYMNQIISYSRENGDIAFLDLQKVSPFCDIDIMSLFGEKIKHIKTLINGLHRPVM
jgi:type I restriction enzyme, R subunit